MFCSTLLYVPSSFASILMGKRELVALLSLSSWCLVIVMWLFLMVPWVCLQFVFVVFLYHTHNLFLSKLMTNVGQGIDGLIVVCDVCLFDCLELVKVLSCHYFVYNYGNPLYPLIGKKHFCHV